MPAFRRSLRPLAGLLALGLLAPAAGAASVGGAAAPTGFAAGGAEYGTALGRPSAARPVARVFRVAPHTLIEGRSPRIAVRIDQRGVPSVRARIAFRPVHGNGTLLSMDLGRVRTGRLLHPTWPSGATLRPGRYVVSLHATGPAGATLQRRASASGRVPITVKAKPAPVTEPIAPPTVAPVPPTDPGVTTEGVFPVAGPHDYGGDDARFGAERAGHIHQGQDVVAAEGTPVVAPLAGIIVARDYQAGGAGFYLAMDATDGRSFFFAHCQKDTFAVTVGQTVAAGQQLCRVGHTGDASGPHLHFEIWIGGWRRTADSHPIDPLPQLQAWDH
jgi:biotin carboxyl carrier protein